MKEIQTCVIEKPNTIFYNFSCGDAVSVCPLEDQAFLQGKHSKNMLMCDGEIDRGSYVALSI